MNKKEPYDQKEKLLEKREAQFCRLNRIQRLSYLNFVLGLIYIFFGLSLLIFCLYSQKKIIFEYFVLLIFGAAAVITSITIGRTKLKSLKEEIQDTEFEFDLLTLKATPEESRMIFCWQKLSICRKLQMMLSKRTVLSYPPWILKKEPLLWAVQT